jgi:hypothetical protein
MFREHVPVDTHHPSCSARHTGDKAQGGHQREWKRGTAHVVVVLFILKELLVYVL